MRIVKCIRGVKGFATYESHLSCLYEDDSLVLDDKVLDTKYECPEKFHGHYFVYLDKETGQTKILDVITGKIQLLPKGVSVMLKGEDPSVFYAYSYSYYPAENKTLYTHFIFDFVKNKIVRELEISRDILFLDQHEGYKVFASSEAGIYRSVSVYSGNQYEILWNRSFGNDENLSDSMPFRHYIGICSGSIVFSTEKGGLTGLDLLTGEVAWVLNELESSNLTEEGKSADLLDWRRVKTDQRRGILYAFSNNVYWEWDIRSCKVVALYDHAGMAKEKNYLYETLDYFMNDDLIYYSKASEFIEHEGRMVWPQLLAVDKRIGNITASFMFKPDMEEYPEVEMFRDFQYSGNRFYLLDTNRNLWVME